MTQASLEHVNITVSEPRKTAEMLCRLFDWKIRWEGPSIHNGYSMHIGTDSSYIAIYSGNGEVIAADVSYDTIGGLNHIAVMVDNLGEVEELVKNEGYETHSHADYEPGQRFYFNDRDGIEYEIVSYG